MVDRFTNALLFYCAFLFDKQVSSRVFPKEIVQIICSHFLSFEFESPFDQKGVLSWLRNYLSSPARENIIDFDCDETITGSTFTRTYFLTPKMSHYDIPQSRSVEILGQESLDGTFCSSYDKKKRHFIVNLQNFRLKMTHITMSVLYRPEDYLESTNEKGPIFYGTNKHPSMNEWEIIENDVEPFDRRKVYSCSLQVTWKCTTNEYYRYFKITQSNDLAMRNEKDYSPPIQILLSGLEMYGFIG